MALHGFYKCGHNKGKSCQFARIGKDFSSTSNPNLPSFQIGSYINCNSKWVIHLITCRECRVQYVGCTSNPLKIRIRRHLSDVFNMGATNTSAATKHFIDVQDRDVIHFEFTGLEKIVREHRGCVCEGGGGRRGEMKRLLLEREAKWMFTLGTCFPAGLNIRQDLR